MTQDCVDCGNECQAIADAGPDDPAPDILPRCSTCGRAYYGAALSYYGSKAHPNPHPRGAGRPGTLDHRRLLPGWPDSEALVNDGRTRELESVTGRCIESWQEVPSSVQKPLSMSPIIRTIERSKIWTYRAGYYVSQYRDNEHREHCALLVRMVGQPADPRFSGQPADPRFSGQPADPRFSGQVAGFTEWSRKRGYNPASSGAWTRGLCLLWSGPKGMGLRKLDASTWLTAIKLAAKGK